MAAIAGNLPFCTHRYGFVVSYIGTKYKGSQRLINRVTDGERDTVQEALEWSLENIFPKKNCRVTAASRTDKGVHALMNCYSMPLVDFRVPTARVKREANYKLMTKNHDIVIKHVFLAPNIFHPRKATVSREYIYRIAVPNDITDSNYTSSHNPETLSTKLPITELYRSLPLPCFNYEKVLETIDLLRGEHDFASFVYKAETERDTIRNLEINLTQSECKAMGDDTPPYTMYELHFKSRSFMYNQVRRIVGAIITYATYGKIGLDHIKLMLESPSSDHWSSKMILAEPWGLYLSRLSFDKTHFIGSYQTNELNEKEDIDVAAILPTEERPVAISTNTPGQED